MSRDPLGYYAWLGIGPEASREEVKAAFRAHARRVHPDVPETGNADAFRLLTEAYRVLSDPARRARYDKAVSRGVLRDMEDPRFAPKPAASSRLGRILLAAIALLAGAGFCAGGVALVRAFHPRAAPATSELAPRPSVAFVHATAPMPAPSAGAPRLGGTPSHYVLPGEGPAVLWGRHPGERLVRLGELAPFTPVHAAAPVIDGMQAVTLADGGLGYVDASRLIQGDAREAERARCAYVAGPPPADGEVLAHGAAGPAHLVVANREPVSAVLTLRTKTGALAARVYLAPGSKVDLSGLPQSPLLEQARFGELWSRGCGRFVTGERTQRADGPVTPGTRLGLAAEE